MNQSSRKIAVSLFSFFCLIGIHSTAQSDNVHLTNLHQPDNRIDISIHYNRTIGLGVQHVGVSIYNKTNDKLRVTLEFYAEMHCGEILRQKIGFGNGIVIKPGETIGAQGFWDSDNTSFDAGNRRSSNCLNSPNKSVKISDGQYTAIRAAGFTLLGIENESDKEREKEKESQIRKLIQEGDSYASKEDFSNAENSYKEALKLDPQNQNAKSKLESLAKKKEAFEKNKEKEENTKKANELLASGDNKAANKDYNGALNDYKEAQKLDPDNSSIQSKISQTTNQIENDKTNKEEEKKKEADEKATKVQQEKEKEEEQERVRREEEKKRAEEEEKRRIEEEKKRVERQQKYYEEKNKQTAENNEAAGELLLQLLMIHIGIGKTIYGNLDEEHDGSTYEGNNWRFALQAGYALTSMPSVFNSSYENYDGNNYSYTDEIQDQQPTTLDLNGGFQIWPFYGDHLGFCLSAEGFLGHGLDVQQFAYGGQVGFRGYAGAKQLQLYGEFTFSFRNTRKVAWIDAQELGYGHLRYTNQRMGAGLRYSADRDNLEGHGISFSLGALYDRPDYLINSSLLPISYFGAMGIKAELEIENRIKAFIEFFPKYYRYGDVEAGYLPTYSANGSYFKVGAYRLFDYFGKSYFGQSEALKTKIKTRTNFSYVSFFNPSFNWLKDLTKGNSPSEIQLGASIGYEKDFSLLNNISATIGGGFNMNGGGNSRLTDSLQVHNHSLIVPIGLRFYLNSFPTCTKPWIASQIKNEFVISENTQYINTPRTNNRNTLFSISGGFDFVLGNKTLGRAGVFFDSGLKSVLENSGIDIRRKAFGFHAGLLF